MFVWHYFWERICFWSLVSSELLIYVKCVLYITLICFLNGFSLHQLHALNLVWSAWHWLTFVICCGTIQPVHAGLPRGSGVWAPLSYLPRWILLTPQVLRQVRIGVVLSSNTMLPPPSLCSTLTRLPLINPFAAKSRHMHFEKHCHWLWKVGIFHNYKKTCPSSTLKPTPVRFHCYPVRTSSILTRPLFFHEAIFFLFYT